MDRQRAIDSLSAVQREAWDIVEAAVAAGQSESKSTGTPVHAYLSVIRQAEMDKAKICGLLVERVEIDATVRQVSLIEVAIDHIDQH
jgi:hypothetical protein